MNVPPEVLLLTTVLGEKLRTARRLRGGTVQGTTHFGRVAYAKSGFPVYVSPVKNLSIHL